MFQPGKIYRRRKLHERYGGQNQGGISTPRGRSFIFLFTGDTGELYGYKDGWHPDGTYRYSGEGQVGDMRFVRGNKAVRDHWKDGKDLHLFEKADKGFVRYVGEMELIGHEFVANVPDRFRRARTAIVFTLSPLD